MNITIIPQSWAPALQAALRIMTGLLFLEHGTGKILSFPDMSAMKPMLGGLWYPTGIVELVGGLLIIAGFLTRPVAFVLSGYCAAAYFIAHMPNGFFPALNYGEPAIFFCFIFLYLAAAGPGLWAVDKN